MEITEKVAQKVLETVDVGLVSGVGTPIPGQMCVEAAVCYALGLPHGDDPQCVASSLRKLKIVLNDTNWSSDHARAKGLRRLAVAQLGSRDNLDENEFVRRLADYAVRVSVPKALRAAASCHPDKEHRKVLRACADRCETEGTYYPAFDAANAAAGAVNAVYDAADAICLVIANAYEAAADAARAARTARGAYYVDAADAVRAAVRAGNAARATAHAAAGATAAYAGSTVYFSGVSAAAVTRDEYLSEYAEVVVQILIDMNAPGCQWLYLTEEMK